MYRILMKNQKIEIFKIKICLRQTLERCDDKSRQFCRVVFFLLQLLLNSAIIKIHEIFQDIK